MRRINGTKKLSLQKHTLRTLQAEQLGEVGGGSWRYCQYMTAQNDPAGNPSGMFGACPSAPNDLTLIIISG